MFKKPLFLMRVVTWSCFFLKFATFTAHLIGLFNCCFLCSVNPVIKRTEYCRWLKTSALTKVSLTLRGKTCLMVWIVRMPQHIFESTALTSFSRVKLRSRCTPKNLTQETWVIVLLKTFKLVFFGYYAWSLLC